MAIPKSASGGNLAILLDTHTLVWAAKGDVRLSKAAGIAIADADRLLVSAVTAWEYADLQQRGRLPPEVRFADVEAAFDLELLDLPGSIWTLAGSLPHIHGDPVDRMLIAHAMIEEIAIVTADETIRRYPVRTLW